MNNVEGVSVCVCVSQSEGAERTPGSFINFLFATQTNETPATQNKGDLLTLQREPLWVVLLLKRGSSGSQPHPLLGWGAAQASLTLKEAWRETRSSPLITPALLARLPPSYPALRREEGGKVLLECSEHVP